MAGSKESGNILIRTTGPGWVKGPVCIRSAAAGLRRASRENRGSKKVGRGGARTSQGSPLRGEERSAVGGARRVKMLANDYGAAPPAPWPAPAAEVATVVEVAEPLPFSPMLLAATEVLVAADSLAQLQLSPTAAIVPVALVLSIEPVPSRLALPDAPAPPVAQFP